VLSTLGFSTLVIFGKMAYAANFDLLSTVSWRLGGAAIALWIWLLIKRQWYVPFRAAIAAFCLGAFGYSVQSALLFNALNHASAGITSVMFFTYPGFVALLSWLTTRKSLGAWRVKALILALIGCVLTVDLSSQATSLLGIALGIGSGAAYALYLTVSARLVKNIPPLRVAAYMLLGATVSIVGWTALTQGVKLPTDSGAIVVALQLSLLATALPIACLFAGLRRLGVVPAAILSTVEPVLAVVMAIVLLGEQLWVGQLIGGALIIGSALMLQINSKR
jgi:drug/metabolite transporter (DMT)-like permease